MSFDPYAELGIPRFVPTGKPVSLKPFSIKRGSGGYIPQKVKSQVVAEKKAEVKKKVIVKRAKEKVKKIVLARKLKGGRRTKQEMSEARGMGMEDKKVRKRAKKYKSKASKWKKMLQEIPLGDRLKTIMKPQLDNGELKYEPYVYEWGRQNWRRVVMRALRPWFPGEELADNEGVVYFQRGEGARKTDARRDIYAAYDSVPDEEERKLVALFNNANTRELKELGGIMGASPTKGRMIDKVIKFVIRGVVESKTLGAPSRKNFYRVYWEDDYFSVERRQREEETTRRAHDYHDEFGEEVEEYTETDSDFDYNEDD